MSIRIYVTFYNPNIKWLSLAKFIICCYLCGLQKLRHFPERWPGQRSRQVVRFSAQFSRQQNHIGPYRLIVCIDVQFLHVLTDPNSNDRSGPDFWADLEQKTRCFHDRQLLKMKYFFDDLFCFIIIKIIYNKKCRHRFSFSKNGHKKNI